MGDPGSEQARPERIIREHLYQYSVEPSDKSGAYADNLDLDCLIVGAGFGGILALHEMRKAGYNAVIYDAGTSYGGTWRWNCYPGARVDSPVPIYELAIPEVYKDWYWSTNYPDWRELQSYFDHVDKVLNLSKDTAFRTVVTSAEFDTDKGRWTVKTQDGRTATCKYLIVSAGFAAKRYIPGFESIDKFKGVIHHSSFWPEEGIDFKDKKVAIIGTGASGVQMIQEMSPTATQLTAFQRTPNLALPMGKRPLTREEQDNLKPYYPYIHALREKCFAGFHYDLEPRNTLADTPEEREALWEKLWKQAGFGLWLGGYQDYLKDVNANRMVYDFWRKKQMGRVKNPEKQKLLFPEEPPHAFGIKRPCLEQTYYEALDRDNVDIVDLNSNAIKEFTGKGIITADGKEREFDIIGLATGFDVVTGGLTNMGLKSIHGTTLQDEWKAAANTYLGTTISGYPNLFHLYGPHGPTLLSNGPSSVEIQVRWIKDAINQIHRKNIKYINATAEATVAWKKEINDHANATLFPTTRSTYMGSSIPGKALEFTCWANGVSSYNDRIREVLDDLKGFDIARDDKPGANSQIEVSA